MLSGALLHRCVLFACPLVCERGKRAAALRVPPPNPRHWRLASHQLCFALLPSRSSSLAFSPLLSLSHLCPESPPSNIVSHSSSSFERRTKVSRCWPVCPDAHQQCNRLQPVQQSLPAPSRSGRRTGPVFAAGRCHAIVTMHDRVRARVGS